MQVTGPHHDEHQENEQRRKHLRVHETALLPFGLQAEKELEEEHEQQLQETPDGAEGAGLVHAFDVLPNEHDHAEVSVQAVADEQGHEHGPPRHVEGSVQLQHDHHRKQGDGNEVNEHLEHSHAQPSGQLLQLEHAGDAPFLLVSDLFPAHPGRELHRGTNPLRLHVPREHFRQDYCT